MQDKGFFDTFMVSQRLGGGKMKYPKLLQKGDTVGICAPSSGASGEVLSTRLDNAISNIKTLGYNVVEAVSVRNDVKCVSADGATRAAEFISLYENPDVAAILPPWGGEFLMDILPLLYFKRLASLPAKWVCGYSDVTMLTFPLTLISDIATIHGSNLMNMGSISKVEFTNGKATVWQSLKE